MINFIIGFICGVSLILILIVVFLVNCYKIGKQKEMDKKNG